MSWKRICKGSVVGFIGFMLSPLSWWNDLFVNVPLAVGFAWLVALLYPPAFQIAVIVGYWFTNVLGFVLLHKGAQDMFTGQPIPYNRRQLARDFSISLIYTLVIVALFNWGLIKPPREIFAVK